MSAAGVPAYGTTAVILPESPKALVGDGALVTWGAYVVTHIGSALIWALTIAILMLRAMILYRQWRLGR